MKELDFRNGTPVEPPANRLEDDVDDEGEEGDET